MTGRFRPSPSPRAAVSNDPQIRSHEPVDFLGARRHIDVVIPKTSIAGKMRMVSRREDFEAEAETRAFLAEYGFPIDGSGHIALGTAGTYSYERMTRILAVAIREPGDTSRALASVDDYRDLDDDQLDALGVRYRDLAAQTDPVGTDSLTSDEIDRIAELAKKKDSSGLMQFGCSKLARYTISSAALPATSPTPSS